MEVAAEDSADLEKVDCEQTTPGDGRKKNLALKLQRLKMKGFGMQRSYTPSGINMTAIYELRLKKLRRNNRSLAKALADQKIETQQWYSEVVSLKGQLQEANERLLRPLDNNSENLIEQEVDRRIKEIGEPLNAAISQAMENLLVVVENFSKVKQVANLRSSISRSSSSSFPFPRSSGSRAPLGSCGNPSSPCQSVRPMVSGHVLQPAMVAIQKLDNVWKARLKERIQEREGEMNMSTIGENSIASVGEENESISQNDTLSTSQQTTEDPSNVSEITVESPSPKSPGKGGQYRRGRRSLDNRRGPFKSPGVRNNLTVSSPSPVFSASPVMSKSGEESNEVSNSSHLEHIEDPLEGPSWWYADSSSCRGRGRGRSRGRGRGRKRGHSRCGHGSPISSVNCSIEASSESEEEESFRKRSKSHINDDITISNDSEVSKQILEHSYLDSPKTMLAKLEDLEAKSGRRSKSKSKGRSLRISEAIVDNVQNQQHNFAAIGKDTIAAHNEDIVTEASESSSMDNKSQPHIDPKAFEDSCVNMPVSIGSDFLIRDSDLTCIGDISMDITEPISKILSQAAADIKKGESKANVNSTEIRKENSKDDVIKNNEKKFFRNETTSCLQKTSETGKTPFDLSLMDDTCLTFQPYSSQKNIEKENMPPDSSRSDLKNDDENNDLNLRRLSIVLKDIMKSSESVNIMPDGTIKSPTVDDELNSNETTHTIDETNSTLVNNKHNSRSKRSFCFSLKSLDPEVEVEDKDAPWVPGKKKRKSTNKKTQKSNRKKNTSDPLSVPKKQTKRKAKSELIVPTTAKICEVMEDVEKNECRTNDEIKNSVTENEVFDNIDDNDPKTLINDCYVKICRTPLKEVRKTIASVDDTCILLEEESLPDFGLLYRKMSTKDARPVRRDSSCMKSEKKMELTEKVPVSFGVLGTTIDACQEHEPDQSEDSDPDHIVPDEGEALCLETGSDNGETMNLSDPVITDKANDLPPINTSERIDTTRMEKDSDVIEMEAPRKRRAASKIASFKEPSLHKKMRRGDASSDIGTSAPSKARSNTRSGRKSSCS